MFRPTSKCYPVRMKSVQTPTPLILARPLSLTGLNLPLNPTWHSPHEGQWARKSQLGPPQWYGSLTKTPTSPQKNCCTHSDPNYGCLIKFSVVIRCSLRTFLHIRYEDVYFWILSAWIPQDSAVHGIFLVHDIGCCNVYTQRNWWQVQRIAQ